MPRSSKEVARILQSCHSSTEGIASVAVVVALFPVTRQALHSYCSCRKSRRVGLEVSLLSHDIVLTSSSIHMLLC